MSKKINIGLPYKGGKGHNALWVISHFPAHNKFVTYCGGGASILINKTPVPAEIYNDINSEVVNFFKVLRNDGENLRELLSLTPYSREELDQALIYDNKDSDLEKARKTAVKALFSFNNRGFRAVANNNTSAPQRFNNWVEKDLQFVISRFKSITIENRDMFGLMKVHDSETTLHYFDPPYLGTDDYEDGMTEEQHIELAHYINNLEGMSIISGYPSALYDTLYPEDKFRKVMKSVNAGSISKGSMRTECLWISKNIKMNLFDSQGVELW